MIEQRFHGSTDEDNNERGWTGEKERGGEFECRSHKDGLEFTSLPEES